MCFIAVQVGKLREFLDQLIPADLTDEELKDEYRRSLIVPWTMEHGTTNLLPQKSRWDLLVNAGFFSNIEWPEETLLKEAKSTKTKNQTVEQKKALQTYHLLTNKYDLMRVSVVPEHLWNMLERVNTKLRNTWIYSQPSAKEAVRLAKKSNVNVDIEDIVAGIDFAKFENPMSQAFLKVLTRGVSDTLLEECLQAVLTGTLTPTSASNWLSQQKNIISLRMAIHKNFETEDATIECLQSHFGRDLTEGWLLEFSRKKTDLVAKFVKAEKKRKAEKKKQEDLMSGKAGKKRKREAQEEEQEDLGGDDDEPEKTDLE